MKKISTLLSLLVCFFAPHVSFAQFTMVTDCSDLYLVKTIEMISNNNNKSTVSYTYDQDRHATSVTEVDRSDQSMTINITWTSSKITYNYSGYEIITAMLDEAGNTKSMTTIDGTNVSYNYENGFLVKSVANFVNGIQRSCHITWQDENPVEVKLVKENNIVQTDKFTFSDIPNNTNIDFGLIQCSADNFALPMGKGLKMLPVHMDCYIGNTLNESCDISYEFDTFNRPIKCTANGIDHENNSKPYTKVLILSYDESIVPLSVSSPAIEPSVNGQTYNILGQPVTNVQKGIMIRNGKEYIVK